MTTNCEHFSNAFAAKLCDFAILKITLSDQQITDINIFRTNLFRPIKFRTILIPDLLIFGEMAK